VLIQRKHVMAACVADSDDDNQFWQAHLSSYERKFTVTTPPPEREIVYIVKFYALDALMGLSTSDLYGFGVTQSLFLEGSSWATRFLDSFKLLVTRLIRNNPAIRYYGVRILYFFSPAYEGGTGKEKAEDEQLKMSLYGVMRSWCENISPDVHVSFEFIECESGLAFVLKDELRRVTDGDKLAQANGLVRGGS
jgi:hypothetical protein